MKGMKFNTGDLMLGQSATSRPYRAVIDWGPIRPLGLQPNLSHGWPTALWSAGLKAPNVIGRAGGPVMNGVPKFPRPVGARYGRPAIPTDNPFPHNA